MHIFNHVTTLGQSFTHNIHIHLYLYITVDLYDCALKFSEWAQQRSYAFASKTKKMDWSGIQRALYRWVNLPDDNLSASG